MSEVYDVRDESHAAAGGFGLVGGIPHPRSVPDSADPEVRVRAWIAKHRDELINLSRRNPLINFKHTKTSSLELGSPGAAEIYRALVDGRPWGFHLPANRPIKQEVEEDLGSTTLSEVRPPACLTGSDAEDGWIRPDRQAMASATKQSSTGGDRNPDLSIAVEEGLLAVAGKDAAGITSALRTLDRRTRQEFLDKGLWVLYLGLGMLRWTESDADNEPLLSPLVMLPVRLERSGAQAPYRLLATDEDCVINPALSAKLREDFDITLPSAEDLDRAGLAVFLNQVHTAVSDQPGWAVESRAVLRPFTFHKDVMYRDVLDNEDALAGSDLINVLALGPDAPAADDFAFDPCPPDQLDGRAAPEDLVSVLDADASQRRCILAARDGHSFVMDGPPGSGKSQTITNMIAELMHAGRSVLFVSEKAAALDVVHKRLAEVGLDEFTLELHSHTATRKSVATELGRALLQRPKATGVLTASGRAELVRRRIALTDYASALNEIRQPLGRSLHAVLGRVASLHHLPHAPAAACAALTEAALDDLLEHARSLGRNWGPVCRGDDFIWRGAVDTSASASRLAEIERRLRDARDRLDAVEAFVAPACEDFGLPWRNDVVGARRLLALFELLYERPEAPQAWLTVAQLSNAEDRRAELAAVSEVHSQAKTELAAIVGRPDAVAGTRTHDRLAAGQRALAALTPPWPSTPTADARALRASAESIDAGADRLRATYADALLIANAFDLHEADLTPKRCRELADLAALVGSPTPPEARWLDPTVQATLSEALNVLGPLLSEFRARREAVRAVFTDAVLALDVRALQARFASVHHGHRKLGSAYRTDKRVLEAATVSGRFGTDLLIHLDDVIALQDLAARLASAESVHASVLGEHYYRREDADLDRISRAIEVARRAIALAGRRSPGVAFATQLGRGGTPEAELGLAAQRLRRNLDEWEQAAGAQPGPGALAVLHLPLAVAVEWCSDVTGALEAIADDVDALSEAAGAALSLETAMHAATAAHNAERTRDAIEANYDADASLLGPAFRGVDTDWSALSSALSWANRTREVLGGAQAALIAGAVLDAELPESDLWDLRSRLRAWDDSVATITGLFDGPRAEEIRADLGEGFGDLRTLLDDLANSVADIEEWSAFARASAVLVNAGLEAVVEFCVGQEVPGGHLVGIMERAVLEAWADSVLETDAGRFGALNAVDRDDLVERFRALDRDQVADAAARAVNICAARRPDTIAGSAGVIAREAQKKTKHMPVRTLLERAGSIALALKPCFMMSPLTVSQFLPSDFRFDVVIFDEASQVRPGDAMNCVYRGRQLIVAGDAKQLPPTSFFTAGDAVEDDDIYDEQEIDEFDSVLDLCKAAGAIPSLPLTWHYRSRHESLITYSNYKFYDGSLHTFPGAIESGPNVGIELLPVDGVYRRGGSRDNPIEAAKIVERVLHHRRHNPEMSLGVITFSAAQEDAIEREIERQAHEHPELGALGTDDRLTGFFVKNLENVQGDERDIILFSVGYGPDEFGKFTLNMGPLNKSGGWRRLNVAITRARYRVEIVSSFLPGQIDADAASPGIKHLRGYLDFASRGMPALALDLNGSCGAAESPFEEEVLRTLDRLGYEAVPQVGVAGYRLDIGVRDPSRPGSYVLGIECDGAAYHSSKVARDRDRLRQQVLEGLGWRIHRIWGPSWYRDRAAQEGRLAGAIEAALRGEESSTPTQTTASTARPVVVVQEADFEAPPRWAVPYRLTTGLAPRTSMAMHEPEARSELRRLIEDVVRCEGPVHEDRVLAAMRNAWGSGRSGSRMREAFDRAVRECARHDLARDRDGILSLRSSTLDAVRVPTDDPSTHRDVRQVPREELRLAIRLLVTDAHQIDIEELSVLTARLFGWRRRGPDIQSALVDSVEALVADASLVRTGEHVAISAPVTAARA